MSYLALIFVPSQKRSITKTHVFQRCDLILSVAEKSRDSLAMGQALKNGVSWCVIYDCEYDLRKRISPIIISVQTEYNTPNSASYHGTSWTTMGKSLLFISHAYRDNQAGA